jgi:citronellol/citronellal dehydrogenase
MLADMWGGMPGMGHSGAARAGMENFTKTASVEWGHAGVRVNAVAPGWVASSGMDTYPEAMKNMIRSLKDHVPLQRIGTESEISAAIVFLLSPGASFISGNTIRIDGAATQGSRAWTLGKAQNSESYNGFHRAYLPAVLQDQE